MGEDSGPSGRSRFRGQSLQGQEARQDAPCGPAGDEHPAELRFSATDVTPRAAFAVRVYRGRKLVKTLLVGGRATNTPQEYSWACRLARGTYTWKVHATDLAANRQRRIGSQLLVVR